MLDAGLLSKIKLRPIFPEKTRYPYVIYHHRPGSLRLPSRSSSGPRKQGVELVFAWCSGFGSSLDCLLSPILVDNYPTSRQEKMCFYKYIGSTISFILV